MSTRVLGLLGGILLLAVVAGIVWRLPWLVGINPATERSSELSVADAPDATPPQADAANGDHLPLPPFPPRIADGDQYDTCMTMIADDPEGAEAIATSWQATGGGVAAIHCQALAAIATGEPETGAAMLERLARGGQVEGQTRAVLLGQAAEARLIADQAQEALQDTTEALAIAPGDADLLISRADANDALERSKEAMDDLNQALQVDQARGDALVLRASIWRRMDQLQQARADVDKALALDPDDADALLERGILRQAAGDLAGAREDWMHVRRVDLNSDAAEVAEQNLKLLDAGPVK